MEEVEEVVVVMVVMVVMVKVRMVTLADSYGRSAGHVAGEGGWRFLCATR